jgi:hypothetical protein
MIPAMEIAGFFLAIGAVLRFSTWAEGWLAPVAQETSNDTEPSATAGGGT